MNWLVELARTIRTAWKELFGPSHADWRRQQVDAMQRDIDWWHEEFKRLQAIALTRNREVRSTVPIDTGEHVGSLTWLQQKQRRIEDNKKRAQEEIAANKAKDNPSAKPAN